MTKYKKFIWIFILIFFAFSSPHFLLSSYALSAKSPVQEIKSSRFLLEQTFSELLFERPLFMTRVENDPRKKGVLLVVEQGGLIYQIDPSSNPVKKTLFINLKPHIYEGGSEMGLLGLALSPNYSTDQNFFVSFTVRAAHALEIHQVSNLQSPTSYQLRKIISIPKTHPNYSNHNGGMIVFGPDQLLYIGTGDGGGAGDSLSRASPEGNAQNKKSLLGKILRIKPLNTKGRAPYLIPEGNPFKGHATFKEEIYAYGLRNPWRFSFEPASGHIWIADVGQNKFEEINVVKQAGQNFGWPLFEGQNPYRSRKPNPKEHYVAPFFEYTHQVGESVTGGYVYRGSELPSLKGHYIFGDYVSGRIWALDTKSQGQTESELVATLNDENISSFGEDSQGELFVIAHSGKIYRIKETRTK